MGNLTTRHLPLSGTRYVVFLRQQDTQETIPPGIYTLYIRREYLFLERNCRVSIIRYKDIREWSTDGTYDSVMFGDKHIIFSIPINNGIYIHDIENAYGKRFMPN